MTLGLDDSLALATFADMPMFEFGTSGAESTFELVRFEVFQ